MDGVATKGSGVPVLAGTAGGREFWHGAGTTGTLGGQSIHGAPNPRSHSHTKGVEEEKNKE